jgi:endogenous inhibitor of DNA gyrase (YacG/DUF329 family)
MTQETYNQTITDLRNAYLDAKKANDRDWMKKLLHEAETFKATYGCYQCYDNFRGEDTSDLFPFCSPACHDLWKEAHPKVQHDDENRQIYTIEEMQRKLLEFTKKHKYRRKT